MALLHYIALIMKAQNCKNHRRYYYPHHFIFYPLTLLLGCLSWHYYSADRGQDMLILLPAVLSLIIWLSFMLRQHYALGNQNRIIRLELRLRYYQLTQQRLELFEERLSMKQLAALRFASDEELPALIQNTIAENLPAEEIKKSIKIWLPDYMRI